MSVQEDIEIGQALKASAKESITLSPFIRGLERYAYKMAFVVKGSEEARVVFEGRVRKGLKLKERLRDG